MDVSFKVNTDGQKRRFNYRLAALLEHDEKILIHQASGFDYTYIPGGRVEIGESSEDAVRRELQEELGISTEVISVPYVVENFFKYEEEIFHEVSLFFKVKTTDTDKLPKDGEERDNVIFYWRHPSNIEDLNLKPEFLVDALAKISDKTEHIINRGDNL